MTANEYQNQAMRTLNSNLPEETILIEGVMGLCGEAGEASEVVKKHIAQGHPLDKVHLAIELGDVAWYLAETAHAIGFTLDDILRLNLEKLRRRYPNGFDTELSMNRKSGDV
jgi:NTP pyrophosphatase (non-canonical NTP hydrolase)